MSLTARLLATLALGLLAGCAGLLNAAVRTSDLAITRDVAYAPGNRRTLDIYRPHDAALLPVVVFLYGGSWRMGDKGMYPFVAAPLARRGAVVVVPDYRVYPEVQFPAFLQDNAKAVAWAVSHAASIGGDPRRVFIVSHSAGAYNAAMLALDPHWLAAEGVGRGGLAGVAGLAGPYDFLPITDPDIIPVFAPVGDGPASQPINYVDGRNPPMLLLAGDADTTVKPRNTVALAAKIRSAGGSVSEKLYPGIGHIGIIVAFSSLFRGKAPVLDDVWAFISSRPHKLASEGGSALQPGDYTN
jgi:acetyl esterase/lipase